MPVLYLASGTFTNVPSGQTFSSGSIAPRKSSACYTVRFTTSRRGEMTLDQFNPQTARWLSAGIRVEGDDSSHKHIFHDCARDGTTLVRFTFTPVASPLGETATGTWSIEERPSPNQTRVEVPTNWP